ncbi:hypothetical protein C0992_001323 [Termitomyces sp. T32_za158]|nr:hypothetical protein C0992_001323 [Termitomyces sp. T32_za158]
MAAVASPAFPHHFGQHPPPPPFIPGRPRNGHPRPPLNHAPSGPYPPPGTFDFDQAAFGPRTPATTSDFDQAAFGPYPPRRPANPPSPDWPDHTRHRRQRNKRVTFSTPSGGFYTPSSSPTIPTQPRWTRQDGSPHRSRRTWSRFLNRFRRDETTAPAEAPPPVVPTVPQSQPPATLEQQREQLISLLLSRVPSAEFMIRPLVNHTHDPRLLQQFIDTLNGPLTQQQYLELQDAFVLARDEQENITKTLNDPRDPDLPILLSQFREFAEAISGRPIPTSDQVPASRDGAFSRLGRLIPSAIRNSLRSRNRNRPQSAGTHATPSESAPDIAQPLPLADDGTERFPIHRIRESQLRQLIVEPFTCTQCQTNIPASCCAEVRAMAIFEYLSVFDEDYLTRIRNFHHGTADAYTNANRLSFLEHAFDPANRHDPRFRGFISILKRTLKYVCFWLEPSVPENVACDDVAYMAAASFLLEVIRAFLMRGIENLAHFRARGYLIHRIVDLLFSWSREHDSALYDLIERSPLVIDVSPGIRRLIWDPQSVWEGRFSTAENPAILENMRNFWTTIENEVGSETLRDAANEFDARLYERGHGLSLFQRA